MANRTDIKQRVVGAAEAALKRQNYVSVIDVFLGIGFLESVHVQDWRRGRIPYLERVIHGNLNKISFAAECFRSWATAKGLKKSETAYVAHGRGQKRDLRFSKSGAPAIEKAYRTHYVSPVLSEKKQQRLQEKLEKPEALEKAKSECGVGAEG